MGSTEKTAALAMALGSATAADVLGLANAVCAELAKQNDLKFEPVSLALSPVSPEHDSADQVERQEPLSGIGDLLVLKKES